MSNMNADQLFEALSIQGMDPEMNGHLLVVTDIWCSQPVSSVFHPTDESEDRSVTIVLANTKCGMTAGHAFAAFVPSITGYVFDSWQELIGKSLSIAQGIACHLVTELFDKAGFDQEKFLSETMGTWSTEKIQEHLDARLEWAALRQALVERSEYALALDQGDATRGMATAMLDSAWMMFEQGGQMLGARDHQ